MQTIEKGVLYIVATPIGNLADLSQRAIDVLAQVDWVAAEDTRHSGKLLQHLAINKRLISLHDYNELARAEVLLKRLKNGESGALVSDAGTPLISDPGFHLVKRLRVEGVEVRPIPGASALIAALSVAGMPTDRFCFEGFLPAKSQRRLGQLRGLSGETRTLVFYESPHRLIDCLDALVKVFGDERRVFIAREMTKHYEQFYADSLGGALEYFSLNAERVRGELVIVLAGAESTGQTLDEQAWDKLILVLLTQSLPVKQVAQIVADYFSVKKNQVYPRVLQLKQE